MLSQPSTTDLIIMIRDLFLIFILSVQFSDALFFGTPVSWEISSVEVKLIVSIAIQLQQRLSVRDLQENSVSGRSVHLLLRRIQNLLRVWEVYREIRPVWRSVQGVRPVPDEPGLHWTASGKSRGEKVSVLTFLFLEMLLQQMPNKAKVQKSPK